jgi:hypothetical protein
MSSAFKSKDRSRPRKHRRHVRHANLDLLNGNGESAAAQQRRNKQKNQRFSRKYLHIRRTFLLYENDYSMGKDFLQSSRGPFQIILRDI